MNHQKFKSILIIFSLYFLVSCSQVQIQNEPEVQNNLTENIEKPIHKSLERLLKPLEKIRLTEIKKIGEYAFVRHSETIDENGWMLPPYRSAKIKMGFEDEPQIGEKVTVIPLQVKLEPFHLKISKVTKTKNSGCPVNSEKEFYWAIDLETVTDKEILEIKPVGNARDQMPFGVFVIYPSVEFAKSLDKSSISKTILPTDVSLKRVASAIDLDNDRKPDLLSIYFCCGDPEKETAEKCPYLCQKHYRKTAGMWKIFEIFDFSEIC